MVEEVEGFKDRLHYALKKQKFLDFSYLTKVRENAAKYKLDKNSYLELIDLLEQNNFLADEIKNLFK